MKKMNKLIVIALISIMLFSLSGKTISASAVEIWIPISQGEALPPVNEAPDRIVIFYARGSLSVLVKNANHAIHQFERKEAILKLEKKLSEDELLLKQLTGSERNELTKKIIQIKDEISSYYKFESAFQMVISTEIPLSISNEYIDTDGSKFYFMQVHFNEDDFSDVMQAVSMILEDPNVISAEPERIAYATGDPDTPETPENPVIPELETDGARLFIRHHYRIVLDRNPDEEGLEYWVNNVKNKNFTPVYVASSFFYSPEYLAKGRTNSEFVTDLYAAIMNREPDKGGLEFWVKNLNEGGKRGDVINFFIDSEEFSYFLADFGFR